MQLKLNLMGALKAKSPPENRLDIADAASIDDVLAALEIAADQVQIVMVNGKPQPDRSTALAHGDELTVVAPVGGGSGLEAVRLLLGRLTPAARLAISGRLWLWLLLRLRPWDWGPRRLFRGPSPNARQVRST